MQPESVNPTLGWNLARDLGEVLEYHFMVNALLAGSVVAVMAGAVGWLMVLRREAFAGHTLSIMSFPGAAAAALVGIAAAWGYFAFCGAGAVAIALLSGRGRGSVREQGAAIGTVQATALALGFLFVSLYGGVLGDLESLLFGNILAISDGQVIGLGVVALVVLAALAVVARPLLFASVDPDVASADGVRVGALSVAFLLILGASVAATSQITGPLLVFALLVAPAATAQVLTARPALSLALTVGFGLLIVWLGMGIAYFSVYPAGFYVATIAFGLYLLARLAVALRARLARAGARRVRAAVVGAG
ncbi:MAG TPA: metal ABC transporter permease [Solirubrobacteraceae bacterium]|jgi:zinc/manganese transport system permease protein|nr:metal ABC transporter permease [Solirubrobacteraceae bacterium]